MVAGQVLPRVGRSHDREMGIGERLVPDDVDDRGLLVLARMLDQLQKRHARALSNASDGRDTYSDGFARGLGEALSLVSRGIRSDVQDFDERMQRIAELEFEIDVLRRYGNKDCTAMADEQLAKKRAGQKCDFED